jgi:hypothetical protein
MQEERKRRNGLMIPGVVQCHSADSSDLQAANADSHSWIAKPGSLRPSRPRHWYEPRKITVLVLRGLGRCNHMFGAF